MEELLIVAKPRKRILSLIIDLLINLVIDGVLLIPSIIAFVNAMKSRNDPNIIALFIAGILGGALIISFALFYFVCLPVIWEGQTIGKKLFNIRIVDATTNEGPSAKVMLLREATRIIIFVLSFGISAITSFFALCANNKKTTFHELMSNTRVVNVNIYQHNK